MYEDLTNEELIQKLSERDKLIEEIRAANEEEKCASTLSHEAEVNSLKAELEETKTKLATQNDELKKTKELNFTLGRQVANINTSADIEETLHNIFGQKDRRN